MSYTVRHVTRTSKAFRDALRSIFSDTRRLGPGRHMAMKACLGSETSKLVVAYHANGKVAGAASYRREGKRIKRICTGAVVRRKGIGTAMIRYIALTNRAMAMYSKNTPEGAKWARKKLGMKLRGRAGALSQHTWTKQQVRDWLRRDGR